jgi:hypothetical protein
LGTQKEKEKGKEKEKEKEETVLYDLPVVEGDVVGSSVVVAVNPGYTEGSEAGQSISRSRAKHRRTEAQTEHKQVQGKAQKDQRLDKA